MGRRGRRPGPYRVGDEEDAPVLSPRAKAELDVVSRLEADSRVRAAALIADTFALDPVDVLAERVTLRRLLRIAAHNIIQTEAQKAAKRGK